MVLGSFLLCASRLSWWGSHRSWVWNAAGYLGGGGHQSAWQHSRCIQSSPRVAGTGVFRAVPIWAVDQPIQGLCGLCLRRWWGICWRWVDMGGMYGGGGVGGGVVV